MERRRERGEGGEERSVEWERVEGMSHKCLNIHTMRGEYTLIHHIVIYTPLDFKCIPPTFPTSRQEGDDGDRWSGMDSKQLFR